MESNEIKIQTAKFVELVGIHSTQTSYSEFDLVLDQGVNLEYYCLTLLNKTFDLPQPKLNLFINHQLSIVQDKIKWLSKFEKLLEFNEDIFIRRKQTTKFNKLFQIISKKRAELEPVRVRQIKCLTHKRFINADSEDRHFSFHEVKDYIETFTDFNDKIIFLTEEIFEYKQADIISMNNKLQPYDEQCNQLIEKLQTIRKMKSDYELEQNHNTTQNNTNQKINIKLQLCGPTNILINAFKQMMVNVRPNGKPYLDYRIKEIAYFINENFVDEYGKPLSLSTIQTYLSPNRIDKDPNNESKIKF